MYYVFIDTNILLTFYSFNEEHLDKLKSIAKLIKEKKINLILTEQVINEFIKNREKKLKTTMEFINRFKNISKGSLTHHDFEEIKNIDAKLQEIKDLSKKLLTKISPMIENETLPADKVIKEIFSTTKPEKVTDHFFSKAKTRHQKGLPPGKKHSYGDAINWELLLTKVPDGKDLYFICADTDFSSLIDENKFHPFLKKEWEKLKSSNVHYYFGSISKFLKEKFPDLEITDDVITTEVQTSGQVMSIMGYYESSPTDKSLPYPGGSAYVEELRNVHVVSPIPNNCPHCGMVLIKELIDESNICPYCGELIFG